MFEKPEITKEGVMKIGCRFNHSVNRLVVTEHFN